MMPERTSSLGTGDSRRLPGVRRRHQRPTRRTRRPHLRGHRGRAEHRPRRHRADHGASPAEILTHYGHDSAIPFVLAATYVLSGLGMAVFLGGALRHLLAGGRRGWATTGFVGAVSIMALFAVVVGAEQALGAVAHQDRPDVGAIQAVWAIHNSVFTVLDFSIAVALFGLAASRGRSRDHSACVPSPRPRRRGSAPDRDPRRPIDRRRRCGAALRADRRRLPGLALLPRRDRSPSRPVRECTLTTASPETIAAHPRALGCPFQRPGTRSSVSGHGRARTSGSHHGQHRRLRRALSRPASWSLPAAVAARPRHR